jgi:hypothetical protein
METSDLKSINDRLVQNIISFGDNNAGKQASLQFNIWKQCIEQREKDEMLFSVLFSIIIIAFTLLIDELIAEFTFAMEETYEVNFMNQQALFMNSTQQQLEVFCPTTDKLLLFGKVINIFMFFVMISGLGYFTAIVQKFTILKLKDNVELSISHLCLEFSVVAVTVVCLLISINNDQNTLITDKCSAVAEYTGDEVKLIGYTFALLA